jgi:hypothetical protein
MLIDREGFCVTRDDMPEFLAILRSLFDEYDREVSDIKAKLWFTTLKHRSLDEVKTAIQRWLQDPENRHMVPRLPAVQGYLPRLAASDLPQISNPFHEAKENLIADVRLGLLTYSDGEALIDDLIAGAAPDEIDRRRLSLRKALPAPAPSVSRVVDELVEKMQQK